MVKVNVVIDFCIDNYHEVKISARSIKGTPPNSFLNDPTYNGAGFVIEFEDKKLRGDNRLDVANSTATLKTPLPAYFKYKEIWYKFYIPEEIEGDI